MIKLGNIKYLLLGPHEVIHFLDLLVYHVQENVSVVYIDGQQGHDALPLMRQDVAGDHASQIVQRVHQFILYLNEAVYHIWQIKALNNVLVEHNLGLEKKNVSLIHKINLHPNKMRLFKYQFYAISSFD